MAGTELLDDELEGVTGGISESEYVSTAKKLRKKSQKLQANPNATDADWNYLSAEWAKLDERVQDEGIT